MKIVLATNNKDKVKEIKDFYKSYKIYAFEDILTPFEIEENGLSFKENSLIKANAVFNALSDEQKNEFIVLSDDSGLSVEALKFSPGIYSARYSGKNATDTSNRALLISNLKALNLQESRAFYTAAICIVCKFGSYTTHGFMHGKVIDEERGNNGFGYDFMFIPNGFDKTISELDENIKLEISHRSKGLELMKIVLKFIEKKCKI
ncbi:RdgB/HAM1 family non-canonical purine NTP pyrophosphatase [Campylobacter sp. FMV-PI01]|uniref:dITP/XTP pyrophosphatase n=1 Tax=Campylobacter portucalensis TaxID=2608384 RepID=A0A6L5WGL7_9BACT|nr:RdgB/HAM1 family non-canonical purine NTP pyrophosphatase [Campylobacter portucalensis]MSN95946.1 RdgB/HAM1 family non-canonical purine NTP pyrophosphatase [Campylobacter portucalensis]